MWHKSLVLAVLMAISMGAHAGRDVHSQPPNAGGIALAGATAGAEAGGYVYTDEDYKASAASAMAASSNTTAGCRYLDQTSVQVVVFGGSKTTMLRDLVCTLGLQLNPAQKVALCIESADYREVRRQMDEPCGN